MTRGVDETSTAHFILNGAIRNLPRGQGTNEDACSHHCWTCHTGINLTEDVKHLHADTREHC